MLATPPHFLPAGSFRDIEATAPVFDQLQREYAALETLLRDATSLEVARAAFRDWDDLRRRLTTWSALTSLRFQQNTADEAARAENERCNELQPKIEGLDVAIKRLLLASPYRAQLQSDVGPYAFALWETDVTAYDPKIEAKSVEEAAIAQDYVSLLASATFDFGGEHLNLSSISKFSEHPDRALRRDAAVAKWSFYAENGATLDEAYDRLVRLRHGMALDLGYDNYVELGYKRLRRTDYGARDVANYRDEIVREIVPLCERIASRQARDLGLDRLAIYDEGFFDPKGSPKPPGSYAATMAAAQTVFDGVSPQVGGFARMLAERGLVDLDGRDGKAGGGFCTSFPTYGLPFIFANFNGTTHDVNVLLHETGHAFQCYSSREKRVSDYLFPTFEACEIHSMSMEFLTWPYLDAFFGDDAERYRRQHLSTSLLFLPYGAAVDEFQQSVYESPDSSPLERHALWKSLERKYLPWRTSGGIEYVERGGAWQQQRHIYLMPFYYIDYTLAMCCALQFWSLALDDRSAATASYVQLCARGGEQPFQSLVRSAGLQSPFEAGVLRRVAARAERMLAL